jgi:hypothetical protein
MTKCGTCGYPTEAEGAKECISCHIDRLEREGEEIAKRAEQEAEERYADSR